MEKIKNDLLQLARNRVPIDTEQLKVSMTGKVTETKSGYLIEIFVPPSQRAGNSSLNNLALGLILEAGGRGGTAKRSQDQPQNPAGSPVADWWSQFVNIDVPQYIRNEGYTI